MLVIHTSPLTTQSSGSSANTAITRDGAPPAARVTLESAALREMFRTSVGQTDKGDHFDASRVEDRMSHFPTGKRRSYALLAAALIALTFGVTAGLTKSGPGQLKADIFMNSFNKACPGGFGGNKKKIGVVTVIREKGFATFMGKLRGAQPGSYDIKLFNSQCGLLLKWGSFNVDGSGDGNFAEKEFICPGQTYFLDFHNTTTGMHNSTKFFKIGSSGPGAGVPRAVDHHREVHQRGRRERRARPDRRRGLGGHVYLHRHQHRQKCRSTTSSSQTTTWAR
jgi:hypothetical protein